MTQNPDIKFLLEQVEKQRTNPPPTTISDYVEGYRVLPQDTPYPGPWRNMVTPYLIEIMDCFAPSSNIGHVAVMKGAQIGMTTALENVAGYYMDASPAPIMIMSSTEDAIKGWGELRLEPLIDSLNIREKLASSVSSNKKSRKTGDTTSMKIYPGGYLIMASAQSASSMRSYPVVVMLRDEIDGAPTELTTGEGNWLSVSEARTNAKHSSRKIFDLSTPTTVTQSNIWRQYQKGDQRKFMVPCPHCGHKQELEMGHEKTKFGLKAVIAENGLIEKVYYECIECHDEIYNHHKTEMLKNGEWVPTAQPTRKLYRSYHISSLYSPVGFLSWEGIYQKYLDGKDNEDERRSFVNLYLGIPYKEKGTRPKIDKLLALVDGSTYREGQVPQEVVFLTMAIDVQTGKNSRLALEICGHGRDFKTASIIYKEIPGAVDNASEGAWKELKEWINDPKKWVFRRKDGARLYPMIAFVDSSDGNVMHTVYNFCSTIDGFFPIKGFNTIKSKNRNPDSDDFDPGREQRYALKKLDQNQTLVKINTNLYKTQVYDNLNILRPDYGADLPRGFSDFPIDRGEEYFKMLIAEERDSKGNYHAEGRRNESLDDRVYNLAACDFYLGGRVKLLEAVFRKDLEPGEEINKKDLYFAVMNELESKNLETMAPLPKT